MPTPTPPLDLIGDIHGHADELEALLKKLGYTNASGTYAHPERTVLFLGDYIDRGPKIKETLAIVRGMVDAGSAVALMGNHEYNAICFHYEAHKGGHVRKHLIKNILQHVETLRQFRDDQVAYNGWIEWFKTLPLFHESENESFRAVHACWDHQHIATLRRELHGDRLTDALIHRMVVSEDPLHHVIEETLKGKEVKLPRDGHFLDKDKNKRHHIRYKWWMDPAGKTYKDLSVLEGKFADEPVPPTLIDRRRVYRPDEPPVFFGHYWLKGFPEPYTDNVCCLDYSVAKSKKDSIGRLVAYSFDGEQRLDRNKFTWVDAPAKE